MKKILSLILFLSFYFYGNAQQTVGLFQNDIDAFNGYTFFAPSSSFHSYLVDNCGDLINQWTASNQAGLAAYLLPNGNILRTARIPSSSFNGGGLGGRIEIYNWNNTLLWSYDHATSSYHQHHDVEYMPNGNVLILAWESRTNTEAINSGRNPNTINNGMWPTRITEVTPTGLNSATVVWEWHLWDHLVQDYDNAKANFGVITDHPELLDINIGGSNPDWLHCNSIDYDPVLDQIIISSKILSELFVIDHSTTTAEAAGHSGGTHGKGGDFLYRWGNPVNYDRGTNSDRQLFGQHDISWVPVGYPDAGKISIFNNGSGRPAGTFSTADIIDPPVDINGDYTIIPGQAYGPSNLHWTYNGNGSNFFSSIMCGANQLENGNMLVCISSTGELREVDVNKDIKWKYIIPVSGNTPITQGNNAGNNGSFRAYKYSPNYSAFTGRVLTPGSPIELNPLPSNCVIYSGMDDDNYGSDIIVYNTLYGNQLYVFNNSNMQTITIRIFNTNGQLVYSKIHQGVSSEINTNAWSSGMYVVSILDKKMKPLTSKKFIK